MRYTRVVYEGRPRWLRLDDQSGEVHLLAGTPWEPGAILPVDWTASSPAQRYPTTWEETGFGERAAILAPFAGTKIVGIGSNYRDHAAEMGRAVPTVPKIFLKPPSAVIGPGATIFIPPGTERVDHEAELGVVIGRRCHRVGPDEAAAYILGCTVVNDVTARDFQKADGVFARAKGFDGFCPVGPWIVAGFDPAPRRVGCRVNGAVRQQGSTQDMVFDVPALVAFVSGIMTLEPGDLLTTGTPAGVGPIVAGDLVSVDVAGIGRLDNPVKNREDRG